MGCGSGRARRAGIKERYMTSTKSERSLVVLQLSGGNDALNTVVPHSNELYYDFRPDVTSHRTRC